VLPCYGTKRTISNNKLDVIIHHNNKQGTCTLRDAVQFLETEM